MLSHVSQSVSSVCICYSIYLCSYDCQNTIAHQSEPDTTRHNTIQDTSGSQPVFRRGYLKTNTVTVATEASETPGYTMFPLQSDHFTQPLCWSCKAVKMEVDTDASLSTMFLPTFKKFWPRRELQPSISIFLLL